MTTHRPLILSTAHRGLPAAALLAGVALIGACGSPATAPTSTATASAAATPTSSAPVSSPAQSEEPEPSTPGSSESSASSGTAGGQTTANGTAAPKLPRDPADYGEALIAAWQAGDSAQIATLTAPAAAATLRSAKAPKDLIHAACEDNLCSWSAEAGQRLTLTYDLKKVAAGGAHAVTAAKVAKA